MKSESPTFDNLINEHKKEIKKINNTLFKNKEYKNVFNKMSKYLKRSLIIVGAMSAINTLADNYYQNYFETSNYSINGVDKELTVTGDNNSIGKLLKHKEFSNSANQVLDKNEKYIEDPFQNHRKIKIHNIKGEDHNIGSHATTSFIADNTPASIKAAAIAITGSTVLNQEIVYSNKTEKELAEILEAFGNIPENDVKTYILLHELMHLNPLQVNNRERIPEYLRTIHSEIASDVGAFVYMSKSQDMDLLESFNLSSSLIKLRNFYSAHNNDYDHNTQFGLKMAMQHIAHDPNFIKNIKYEDIDVYSYMIAEFVTSVGYGENNLNYKDYIGNAIKEVTKDDIDKVYEISYSIDDNLQNTFESEIYDILQIDNPNKDIHNKSIKISFGH